MTEAKLVLRRVVRFRAFPVRVGPRILSLERAHYYFGTSEHFSGRKKRTILISKTSIVSVVSFHSMQMSLVMSMQFIFGDD